MEDYAKEILRRYSTFPVEVVEAYNSLSEYMSEKILVEAAGVFIATPKKRLLMTLRNFCMRITLFLTRKMKILVNF